MWNPSCGRNCEMACTICRHVPLHRRVLPMCGHFSVPEDAMRPGCLCVLMAVLEAVAAQDDETSLTTPQLVRKYGYVIETYTAVTTDGFLLTLHRIPRGKLELVAASNKPLVFLQHGLTGSSADWVITGPDNGLAYILADAGYDVWMGNVRANTYSPSNMFLPVASYEYWQFTWHEKGDVDLSAMLDLALTTANRPSLYYVGFSSGCTMLLVLTSMRPEYNNKLRAAFLMSPAAFMQHVQYPLLQLMSKHIDQLEWFATFVGMTEFGERRPLVEVIDQKCPKQPSWQRYCDNLLFRLYGFNTQHWDQDSLPKLLSHLSRGTSVKEMLHWGQNVKRGTFCQFDYGASENRLKYNASTPPCYDLSRVKCPVGLYYSKDDMLVTKKDVDILASMLPNLLDKYELEDFNHLDFMWATNARVAVYNRIIDKMKLY